MTTTLAHEPLDDAQFTLGMTRVTPSLRSYARSLAGDRELASDLTQDTLMRAWAARARFIPGSNMKAWLFRILHNAFLSHLRRRRHARTDTYGDDLPDMPVAPNQEVSVAVREVAVAWRQLSADHRAALQMIGIDGLSYEVAASSSNVSVGTLKSRVSRARSALRSRLETGDTAWCPTSSGSVEPGDGSVHAADRLQIDVLRRWFRENGRARG